tara:strand:- start:200 stop:412 length:213 start_codon:yes stop_codon:yes gene_type:complete
MKLKLSKITISKLTKDQTSSIYGGTQGNNGCGTKTIDLHDPACRKQRILRDLIVRNNVLLNIKVYFHVEK